MTNPTTFRPIISSARVMRRGPKKWRLRYRVGKIDISKTMMGPVIVQRFETRETLWPSARACWIELGEAYRGNR